MMCNILTDGHSLALAARHPPQHRVADRGVHRVCDAHDSEDVYVVVEKEEGREWWEWEGRREMGECGGRRVCAMPMTRMMSARRVRVRVCVCVCVRERERERERENGINGA